MDRGQDARQLELSGGRALELETGAAAAHLDAEGIAARSTATRSPAGARPAARAHATRQSPSRRARRHRTTGRSMRPPAAPRGRTGGTAARAGGGGRPRGNGLRHLWRSCAGRDGDCRSLPGGPSQGADCGVSKSFSSRSEADTGTAYEPACATQHHSFDITAMDPDLRARCRRPLGVRLRLADVAARFSLRRAGRGAAHRGASGALRLFLRPSRDARAARSGARPRPRWDLSRHRLSRGCGRTRTTPSPICARASR